MAELTAIQIATQGKKTTELSGAEQEFKMLGLKMANIIACLDIVIKSPDSDKKGYVIGYLKKENEAVKIRRAVLTALYKPAIKK